MSRKTKIVVAIVAVIVIAAITFFGVKNQMRKDTDDENVIKIGAILPLTGNLAFAGESCRDGVIFAVEKFNSKSSAVKFQILFADSKGTVKDSISAYKKLQSRDDISILFCGTSVTAKAVVSFSPSILTLLALVSDSKVTLGKNNIFNLTVNSNLEIQSMFDFWVKRHVNKIALFYQKDELGLEAKEVIQRLASTSNIKVVSEEEITDSASINQGAIRIVSSKPDAIFIATVGSNAAIVARRLKELSYKGIICSFQGFHSPSVINQAGNASNGVYVCFTPYDLDDDHSQGDLKNFRLEYSRRFGRKPDYIAAYSYCIVNLALQTCEQSGFDIEKTRIALSKIKDMPSIFGKISCDSNRIFVFPIQTGVIQNGKLERIAP